VSAWSLPPDTRLDPKSAQACLLRAHREDTVLELGIHRAWKQNWLRVRFLDDDITWSSPVQFRILSPLDARGEPVLRQGEEILAYWTVAHSGYAMPARVLSMGPARMPTGVQTHATVLAGGDVYRFQRRAYVRVPPMAPLAASLWLDDLQCAEWPPEDLPDPLLGNVEDLSVGGIRVRCEWFKPDDPERFAGRTPIRLSLRGEDRELGDFLSATVMRAVRESHPRKAFWMGIEWRRLTDKQTTTLTRYVLEAERHMLRARRKSALSEES
jgi:hypothetical protein